MKHLVCIFIFLSAALFDVPAFGDEKRAFQTIRVGIYEPDPYTHTDKNGRVRGLYPDLIQKIAEKENWAIEFVPGTWAEGLDRLQAEKIDLMTAIAFSPERNRVMDFTREPVFDMWGQVFLRPGSDIHTISDLEGARVAVMERDITSKNFIKTIERLEISCEIIHLPSQSHVFRAIQEGKAAAGVVTQYFGLKEAHKFDVVASSIQFTPFSLYFAAKKGRLGTCLNTIDSHISRWKKDKNSYYHKRLSFWTGAGEYETETIPRWLLIAVAATAAVSTLLAYINRVLKNTVKKRTRELRSREKEYRDLVESANSIILRVDKYGRVLFLNRFGLNLFGYTREEIYGRNVIGTILTPEKDEAPNFTHMIEEIFRHPGKYELIENENVRKDGQRIYIQWSNRAITDHRGRFHEILSIGTDITQRRHLEATLSQAQKMEAIGTLAGGIAHDFNNILSVIFGYTELAHLYSDNPQKVREALEQVSRGGRRAKELVSQILAFSRHSKSEKHPLQPSLIIKEAVKLLRPSLPATISFENTLESRSKIMADPTQVHQIIMNLCTNAFHAMEATGGTLRIVLRDTRMDNEQPDSQELSTRAGEYVLLEVSDTGSGIDPENMQKIFDPYFTTKEKNKGTGLGLSVVHGIVREHKGHIDIQSTPNKGTAFRIYFPVLKGETDPTTPEPADEKVTGGDETILVIDDEPEIAATLADMLSGHGYTVHTFTDGIKALDTYRKEPDAIDLVVTDMTMPAITGSRLARKMLSLRPDLPVILCTGYSELITSESSRKIGIAEYLQKPVMMTTLLQTVRKQLDIRQAGENDNAAPTPQPQKKGR